MTSNEMDKYFNKVIKYLRNRNKCKAYMYIYIFK